jgi:hypothetical protein
MTFQRCHMAKPKQKVAKTPKKRSTKYGKLAAVCSKELVGKKAALVRAEKALAKAQRTHTELLSEVARLDMLDRSLKALINGTEAPQNVRYVYSYPQWVWYGNPYGWWWNGNTWQVNLGSQNGYNFQGGQCINTINTVPNQTITTTAPLGSGLTTTTGALNFTSGSTLYNVNCSNVNSNLADSSSGVSLTASSSPSWQTFTTSNASGTLVASNAGEITVDLSTGVLDIEDGTCPDCGVETPEEGAPLKHDASCPQLKTEAESIEVVSKVSKVGHGG